MNEKKPLTQAEKGKLTKNRRGQAPGTGKGTGRKPGSKNKLTKTVEELVLEQALKQNGSVQTPLAFLTAIYLDPTHDIEIRRAAARDCLPYVHKKLPTTNEITGANGVPFVLNIDLSGDAND